MTFLTEPDFPEGVTGSQKQTLTLQPDETVDAYFTWTKTAPLSGNLHFFARYTLSDASIDRLAFQNYFQYEVNATGYAPVVIRRPDTIRVREDHRLLEVVAYCSAYREIKDFFDCYGAECAVLVGPVRGNETEIACRFRSILSSRLARFVPLYPFARGIECYYVCDAYVRTSPFPNCADYRLGGSVGLQTSVESRAMVAE